MSPTSLFRRGVTMIWASPSPKTLVIKASPFHNTLAIWVRVTGDAHIRLFEIGIPKRRGCPYHCERGLFVSRGGWREPKRKRAGHVTFFRLFSCCFCNTELELLRRKEAFHLNYEVCLLLAVTTMEMNDNLKKLGQLFRHKSIKVT